MVPAAVLLRLMRLALVSFFAALVALYEHNASFAGALFGAAALVTNVAIILVAVPR